MDFSKLRTGELVAAVGGVILLIAMFLFNWYEQSGLVASFEPGVDVKAWEGLDFFSTIANLIILAAAVCAVTLAVLAATSRTLALPVAASALTAGLGFLAVLMVLGRMVFQPGPNEVVDLRFGILLALIGAAVATYGGWRAMQDDGTSFEDAREQLRTTMANRDAPRVEPVAPEGPVRDEPPAEPSDIPGAETSRPPPRREP
jgi:hypothetical protein